ncbi:MAG: sigma 54-interacting transcriptional regulator [Cellvibrio sp.]|uniref:sigma 54-interacting transcriptional regulator n=1 Tax=Cellvibrio sp. TaxID=1965322 RepID=UPI002721B07F|nr:sigma 54-interacting transcriptional regulator [Cellvibrio sp.]
MNNADLTLTSPITRALQVENPLLCLTILWHPELERIGDQTIITGQNLAISRYHPLFSKPEQPGLALGHGGISRSPLELSVDLQGGVTIAVQAGRMLVELDGKEIQGNHYLQPDQISNGTILGLGRAVLLCLHWLTALPKNNAIDGLIGVGSSTQKVRDLIRQVAATDTTVLLLGETGTGKEVVAQSIHSLSLRKHKPLVSVNMAALNDDLAAADLFGAAKGAYTGAQTARNGFFQEAEEATLFLDEIGNAPASVQPMLLRVLETGDYRPLGATKDLTTTARIIAATDQDLYGGGFNPALLRRLESFVINLPPLRNRREDLGVLIMHLMQSPSLNNIANKNLSFSLLTQFALYDWPGNIRQLRHFLKRVLLGMANNETPAFSSLIDSPPQRITYSAEPTNACSPPTPSSTEKQTRKKLNELTEEDVINALEDNEWNIQSAAQALGISRPSMYKLMEVNSQIRRVGKISAEEIQQARRAANNDIEVCASLLKTPAEALRRHLRGLDLNTKYTIG